MTPPRSRYYPEMPPVLPGETLEMYTDRLTGADRTDRRPYDHPRNRQCSLGYHDECSDPTGERCKCPCHEGNPQRAVEEWARMCACVLSLDNLPICVKCARAFAAQETAAKVEEVMGAERHIQAALILELDALRAEVERLGKKEVEP